MAKRCRTDRGAAAALDQVLLGLFAGQLLLEPADAKRSGEPGVCPAAIRPLERGKGKPGNRPAATKPRKA